MYNHLREWKPQGFKPEYPHENCAFILGGSKGGQIMEADGDGKLPPCYKAIKLSPEDHGLSYQDIRRVIGVEEYYRLQEICFGDRDNRRHLWFYVIDNEDIRFWLMKALTDWSFFLKDARSRA